MFGRGHRGEVFDVDVSPDGELVVSAGEDQTLRLYKRASLATTSHRVFEATVYCVRFSHDGKRLATGETGTIVRILDCATLRSTRVLRGHLGAVRRLTWSHNDKLLATASLDNTVRIWDTTNGRALYALRGHTDWVCSVAFSSDDQLLVSGGWDKNVRLWSTANGKELALLKEHTSRVFCVGFTADDQHVLSAARDNLVIVWDTGTRKKTRQYPILNMPSNQPLDINPLRLAAFSGDGSCLACVFSQSNTRCMARISDVASGKDLGPFTDKLQLLTCMVFSADGLWIVAGAATGDVVVWPTPPIAKLV